MSTDTDEQPRTPLTCPVCQVVSASYAPMPSPASQARADAADLAFERVPPVSFHLALHGCGHVLTNYRFEQREINGPWMLTAGTLAKDVRQSSDVMLSPKNRPTADRPGAWMPVALLHDPVFDPIDPTLTEGSP